MLDPAAPIAFLPSTDLDRSRRFFADVFGLTATDVTPFACVYQIGPTMLRVTKVDELRIQPFTVFGWRVLDIDAAVRELTGAGVTFLRYDGLNQDTLGVWTTPGGDKVAWFHDPDGNVLSLTQFTLS
jgi:catechol 2,3-dioxygenase-like lactoylglutathione lyase family enzyme